MVTVIIFYRMYVGKTTEYMEVEPDVNLLGTVTDIKETESSLAVTITDVTVHMGTSVKSYEKILSYIKSEKSGKSQKSEILIKSDNLVKSQKYKIKIGNIIQINGTAKAFQTATNDGQFNSYRYYRENDYAYMVYAEDYLIIDARYNMKERLRQLSEKCISIYNKYLPEEDAAIISAMIFGRKNLLVEEDRELYKINGLMHILAVSGVHISIVAAIFIFIIGKLPLEYKSGRCIMFVLLVLYGIMTGFGVACIRAVIMFGVKLLAELAGRTYDVLSALSFSAIITLLINPRCLFHCDFILSYLAVVAISVIYPVFAEKFQADKGWRQVIEKMLLKPFLLSVCAWVVTMPAVLFFYYEIPVYSMVINLIVIPFVTVLFIVSWLIIPVGFAVPGIAAFFAGSIHVILEGYRWICNMCMEYIYDLRIVGFPAMAKIMICYPVILLLILIYRKMNRNIFKLIVISLFVFIPVCVMSYQKTGDLKISFLDVGQGDGIVMSLPDGKVVCIDGGSSDVDNLAKYRLEPFLSYNGIKHIDCYILTHIDIDHYSGLQELLERKKYNGIDIDNIVISDSEVCKEKFWEVFGGDESRCLNESTEVECIKTGQEIGYGGAKLKCLNPNPAFEYNDQNDSSVVLELSYGEFDVLLTGDISNKLEEKIIAEGPVDDKKYEILKVAHHGSKESSCEKFLQAVNPELAVISCGKDNGYGHPHDETIERLNDVAKQIYITAECGQVTVRVRKNMRNYIIECSN